MAGGGEKRGKDDRKQNMLAPLVGGMKTCISLLLATGQGTARANYLPLCTVSMVVLVPACSTLELPLVAGEL